MRILMPLAALILLAGCASSETYVTYFSNDGRGNLIIKKCGTDIIEGTLSTGECSSQKIFIGKHPSYKAMAK